MFFCRGGSVDDDGGLRQRQPPAWRQLLQRFSDMMHARAMSTSNIRLPKRRAPRRPEMNYKPVLGQSEVTTETLAFYNMSGAPDFELEDEEEDEEG